MSDKSDKSDKVGDIMVFRGEARFAWLSWEKANNERLIHIEHHMGCKVGTCPVRREMTDKVENFRLALVALIAPESTENA